MRKHVVRIMVLLAACLLVTTAAHAAGEEYVLSQGNFSTIIQPISYNRTAAQFYTYGTGNIAGVIANTGFERKRSAILLLYRDTSSNKLNLMLIHSVRGGAAGRAAYTFSGIPAGAVWTMHDDPVGGGNLDYYASNPFAAEWHWFAYYTDGGAIGDISGFKSITINPNYKSGIDNSIFVTGDVNNPQFIDLNLNQPFTITAMIPVAVDIKPGSCPNPINTESNGVISVALSGTAQFDVAQVDPATVTLSGVAPLRVTMADVATPYEPYLDKGQAYDCTTDGPDGIADLVFKFDKADVVQAMHDSLGSLTDRETVVLSLTGNLYEEYGGLPIQGEDVVIVLKKGKK